MGMALKTGDSFDWSASSQLEVNSPAPSQGQVLAVIMMLRGEEEAKQHNPLM